jgi:hypothetical protein
MKDGEILGGAHCVFFLDIEFEIYTSRLGSCNSNLAGTQLRARNREPTTRVEFKELSDKQE